MAQGFTRGTPIDTDPTLSLDSDLVVPSQKAIKDYVDTGLNTKQDTITLTTTGTSGPATLTGATLNIPQYGGGTVTNVSASVPSPASPAFSVNVVNPTSTPDIQITATGTTNEYVRGDGSKAAFPSVLLGGGKFAWMTEIMDHTALINTIEYVSSVNKLYVASGGNNVAIFDATSGELLSTVLVTAALRVRYISSINEIWCTSVSAASITRISPTTNASLGTITTGVIANGFEILEYSSTKVFITIASNPATIQVFNPSTLALTTNITTNVPAFASGMALNNNPASLQFDKIIVTSSGLAILNPNTNTITTTLVNPSSSLSVAREIYYSSVDDKYYVASQSNNRLVCFNIDSATTFSVNRIKHNTFYIMSLQIDETSDLIILNQVSSTGNTNTMCHFIKKSTFESLTNINTPSVGGANTQAGFLKLDLTNRRVFIAGRATSRSIVTVKYL